MTILIGTDEAGYGPNLGPLVIGATVWECDAPLETLDELDLLDRLSPFVVDSTVELESTQSLALADSKKLYQPGAGLAQLERGVLASVLAMGRNELPTDWIELCEIFTPRCRSEMEQYVWNDWDAPQLPLDAPKEVITQLARRWSQQLADANLRLLDIRAEICFPERFNKLLEEQGGKGALLSWTTLELVEEISRQHPEEPIFIQCDKHGGRNKYSPILQSLFPEYLVEVYQESREKSLYRWGPKQRRMEAQFVTKGERFLPAALASMTAKYVRELSMKAFNHFWCERVNDLKPTAGYPLDAKRFKKEIAGVQKEIGMSDQLLWRNR